MVLARCFLRFRPRLVIWRAVSVGSGPVPQMWCTAACMCSSTGEHPHAHANDPTPLNSLARCMFCLLVGEVRNSVQQMTTAVMEHCELQSKRHKWLHGRNGVKRIMVAICHNCDLKGSAAATGTKATGTEEPAAAVSSMDGAAPGATILASESHVLQLFAPESHVSRALVLNRMLCGPWVRIACFAGLRSKSHALRALGQNRMLCGP